MLRQQTLKALGVCVVLAITALSSPLPSDFDWLSITPNWDLQYEPCYEEFQCARMLMPLDWLDPDQQRQKSRTVALALIKLPASAVPAHDSKHGGVVLVNPGGPGDSGILHILRNGHYMRSMVDTEGERYFDLVSFDPRGMANSVPIADCFENEAVRALWDAQNSGITLRDDGSNATLAKRIARDTALGMKCKERKTQDGDVIQEFMSTASVARDMLRIVDELDFIKRKEEEAARAGVFFGLAGTQRSLGGDGSRNAENGATGKLPRIQYYGTSYGTMLGNTFISMFPGRVKRMVLDGVVVPEDYIVEDWCGNLEDTTAVFDYFYKTCFTAGPAKCALVKKSDHSWHAVRARVDGLVNYLDENPVPVVADGIAPTILEGTAVIGRMMDPIYNPLDLYSGLAETLALATEGNYTALLKDLGMTGGSGEGKGSKDMCKAASASEYMWMGLSNTAVRCGDADDVRTRDLAYWRDMKKKCVANSPDIGELWMRTSCAGWQSRPRDRFTGPFGSPQADVRDVDGKPSAPVLFLSPRYDPVTPLTSARQASKNHAGSKLVVQKSVGHCVLLSAPGECVKKIMRRYMLTGELPEAQETVCEADCKPWEECDVPRAVLPR